jgi:ribonuclease HI
LHRFSKVIIYTDGAARGNPGPSASGYSICDEHGKQVKGIVTYNGIKTNNFAEYTAVILALEWCTKNIADYKSLDILLYSDSEVVVRQLNGHYKVKAIGLKPLNEKARKLSGEFKSVTFKNLPREHSGIRRVDSALNALLDKRNKYL